MSFQGHIHNGVVIFDEAVSLPEGTAVRVEPVPGAPRAGAGSWDSAMQAASELADYDFDAWRRQRDYDLQHAGDHLP
jgi:hypothetical protein